MSTSTSSTCATILGCNVEDESGSAQVSTCTLEGAKRRREEEGQTARPAPATQPTPHPHSPRATECPSSYVGPAIIYLKDRRDQTVIQTIRNKLAEQQQEFHEARSETLGYTAYFWVKDVDKQEFDELKGLDVVSG